MERLMSQCVEFPKRASFLTQQSGTTIAKTQPIHARINDESNCAHDRKNCRINRVATDGDGDPPQNIYRWAPSIEKRMSRNKLPLRCQRHL